MPYPVELVFAFFADPCSLPAITVNWRNMRLEEARIVPPPQRPASAVTSRRRQSAVAGIGSKLNYSIRPLPLFPVRLPWQLVITEFAWNQSFVENGVRMPFPYWEHLHSFDVETRTNPEGALVEGTLMRDELDYEPPGEAGWLEHHLHNMVIHRMIKQMFLARERKLDRLLPSLMASVKPLQTAPRQPA